MCLAQTQTPRLLSNAVFILPSGWEKVYDPMEVQALIKINADSSAHLIRIMDDKRELSYLIEDYVQSLQVTPLIIDGNVRDTELLITIALVNAPRVYTSEEDDKPLPIASDKGYIYQWIEQVRMDDTIHNSSGHSCYLPPQMMRSDLYRSNYHFYGSIDPQINLRRMGISLPPSIFQTSLHYQNLRTFHTLTPRLNELCFEPRYYNQPVPLTVVQAGLGDYDHNYARGALYKNHFLDTDDLFFSFAFLVQDGWWLEQMSGQTSWNIHTRYQLNDYIVSLYYDNMDNALSSTNLKSIYWQSVIYNLEHKMRSLILSLQTPYADLKVMRYQEQTASSRLVENLINQGWLFSAGNRWDWTDAAVELQYEKAFRECNYEPLFDPAGFADRLILKTLYRHNPFIVETKLALDDFSAVSASGEFTWRRDVYETGVYARFRSPVPETFDQTDNLYLQEATLNSVNISQALATAIFVNWDRSHDLQINTAIGWQKVINNIPLTTHPESSNRHLNRNLVFADLNAHLDYHYQGVDWRLEQTLNWQQPEDELREYQVWRYQSRFQLTRPLPKQNALFGGLALTGHSSYISANELARFIEDSVILDAWAGFRITDLFEFTVSLKNLNDGFYYGAYPIPRSIHASVTWFYLN